MELTPIYRRVIGLDVHQAKISACALIEHEDGRHEVIQREFGAFKRDRRALAQWAQELAPQVVVMESTGIPSSTVTPRNPLIRNESTVQCFHYTAGVGAG